MTATPDGDATSVDAGTAASAPADAGDVAAALRRLRAEALRLGWRVPFFLPALAALELVIDPTIAHAGVDAAGRLRVHPRLARELPAAELRFVIAHAAMHLLLLPEAGQGARDAARWDLATDQAIHHALAPLAARPPSRRGRARMIPDDDPPLVLPSHAVRADAACDARSVTALYEAARRTDDTARAPAWAALPTPGRQGALPVGAGCGMLAAPAEAPGMAGSSGSAARRTWREVAAACQQVGRATGDERGARLAATLDPPPSRVPWGALLRGALYDARATTGRDDVAWSRRSRRAPPGVWLPGGVSARPRAALVIDTSGSMTAAHLARAVREAMTIVAHARMPVFVVLHDDQAYGAAWLHPGQGARVRDELRGRFGRRGGTDFDAAYARVAAEGPFHVMIHLTDGQVLGWPARPRGVRRLVVGLVGPTTRRDRAPTGARCVDVAL